MRTTSNHAELRGVLRPESTPCAPGAHANESVGRDESDARRHRVGTCSFDRSPMPNPHEEVNPSHMIVLLPPTCLRDASTRHAPTPIPAGELAVGVYWPTATALTEARRRHTDRGKAPLRAPGDEAREASATGAGLREADRRSPRTKTDRAAACSWWCWPDVAVQRTPHGGRGRVAVGLIASELLALGPYLGGCEEERIATPMQEVARATIGSEDDGPSGSREPSPAYSPINSNHVQHQQHSRDASGSEELARGRPRSTSPTPWPYPRHGRALQPGGSAPRVRGPFQSQQGSACPHSADLSATARQQAARDRAQGLLARPGEPDGVASARKEEALAISGPSVGGPGSCSRGCRGGAIRCGVRVGLRQGSPAEGLRPTW